MTFLFSFRKSTPREAYFSWNAMHAAGLPSSAIWIPGPHVTTVLLYVCRSSCRISGRLPVVSSCSAAVSCCNVVNSPFSSSSVVRFAPHPPASIVTARIAQTQAALSCFMLCSCSVSHYLVYSFCLFLLPSIDNSGFK